MKLRNKKTGEVFDYTPTLQRWNGPLVDRCHYNSLAELNDNWEDYEEPKEYWYIGADGSIVQNAKPDFINHLLDGLKSVGNYFETKEEAEKAVEKLKAWKRLKDNGIKFEGWERDKKYCGDYAIKMTDHFTCDDKDLDLLFGGEE